MKRLLAAVATGLALAAPAATAQAAATGRITEITSDDGALRVIFTARDLPEGVTLDPASIQVSAAGTDLDAKAELVRAGTVRRTAVLAIDTSGSMKGEGIAGAVASAQRFLDAVPADVSVGVVTFAEKVRVAVAPTTDRGAARAAIRALTPAGETSLYDGVLAAVREAGTSGVRSVLVLSDGADTRSRAKLPSVLDTARTAGTPIDVVAFKTPEATGAVLDQIARAAGGRSLKATAAGDVDKAFASAARSISNQLTVTAPVPAALAGKQATVTVAARAGETLVTDEAAVTLSVAPPAEEEVGPRDVDVSGTAFGTRSALYGGLLALFVGLLLILLVGFGSMSREAPDGRVKRRLSLYTLTGRVAPAETESSVLGDSSVARSAVDFAGRVVARRDFEAALGRRLERADVPLRPAEWLLVHSGTAVGLALLLLLLSGGKGLPALVGLLLGALLPYGYLGFKASRRSNAFVARMPDTLQLLAGSLQAGYSFPQAIDAVVQEGEQPVSGEFGRAIVETRLGVPIEDALDNVAERIGSKDFAWVVMAVRIQREVGGNLAEVLGNVATTMRERERVRRQVRVLSAEGRLSAWILGGLPPLFALYLLLIRPEYIKPLYTDKIGIFMLVVAGIQFGVGLLWLRKAVRVEV